MLRPFRPAGRPRPPRLSRSGNRRLNRALHTVAVSWLRSDEGLPRLRRAEAKTDREIKRCLQRYIARRLYRHPEGLPTSAACAA